MKVGVIGAAGYVGGELLRVLLQHPEVTDLVAVSRSRAGDRIGDVHPGLAPLTDRRLAADAPADAARGRDVVFLALEHGASSRIAAAVLSAGPALVVDLAADFRVSDLALYERSYGTHASPELLPRFTYALADVLGTALHNRNALAVPGCFATAAQLALYPLAAIGAPVAPVLFAVTGSSGAGVQRKSTTHHATRAHNLFAYSVLNHRHEAEILQRWREWTGRPDARARLMTHAGPFVRGIYLTMHADLNGAGAELRDWHGDGSPRAWYERAYAGRPFVRILDGPPELTHAIGTNHALMHVAASDDGRELQVTVAVDNLIKGAGGQAVQAMNLALGIPEEAGLRLAGAWPC